MACSVIILGILTTLTWLQCGYWKNSIELFNHALQVTEKNDLAHYNLGNAFRNQSNIEEALKNYEKALQIDPLSLYAHNNIGIIMEMYYKKYDEAIYHYRQELKIQPKDSGVHYNLGIALSQKGELEEAIKHFQTALYLRPDYDSARQWLRLTLEEKQKQFKK